jgi:hypothetical protein
MVDDDDLRLVVRDIFSSDAEPRTDLNGDGETSAADLIAFLLGSVEF